MTIQTSLRNESGPYFGDFGGRFVPEALIEALEGLEMKGEVTEIGASALVRGSGSQGDRSADIVETGNESWRFKDSSSNIKPSTGRKKGSSRSSSTDQKGDNTEPEIDLSTAQ